MGKGRERGRGILTRRIQYGKGDIKDPHKKKIKAPREALVFFS